MNNLKGIFKRNRLSFFIFTILTLLVISIMSSRAWLIQDPIKSRSIDLSRDTDQSINFEVRIPGLYSLNLDLFASGTGVDYLKEIENKKVCIKFCPQPKEISLYDSLNWIIKDDTGQIVASNEAKNKITPLKINESKWNSRQSFLTLFLDGPIEIKSSGKYSLTLLLANGKSLPENVDSRITLKDNRVFNTTNTPDTYQFHSPRGKLLLFSTVIYLSWALFVFVSFFRIVESLARSSLKKGHFRERDAITYYISALGMLIWLTVIVVASITMIASIFTTQLPKQITPLLINGALLIASLIGAIMFFNRIIKKVNFAKQNKIMLFISNSISALFVFTLILWITSLILHHSMEALFFPELLFYLTVATCISAAIVAPGVILFFKEEDTIEA